MLTVPRQPAPRSPSSFVSAHLCAQRGGDAAAAAAADRARPHAAPCIDALQLFPNPALDFDPLPSFKCGPKGNFGPGGLFVLSCSDHSGKVGGHYQ